MNEVNVSVSGDSDVVKVYLFKHKIDDLLASVDFENNSIISILRDNADKEITFCQGFNDESSLMIRVTLNEKLVFDGGVLTVEFDPSDSLSDISAEIAEYWFDDPSFEKAVTCNLSDKSEFSWADEHFLSGINKSDFETIVIFRQECFEATSEVSFEVERGFKLCDLRPLMTGLDDIGGIVDKIYQGASFNEKSLEGELIGFRYKGETNELNEINQALGQCSVSVFQKTDLKQEESNEVDYELNDALTESLIFNPYSELIINCKEQAFACLRRDSWNWRVLPDSYKFDRDVLLLAIQLGSNPDIDPLPESLKNDKEFILRVIESGNSSIFYCSDNLLLSDSEFVSEALSLNPMVINDFFGKWDTEIPETVRSSPEVKKMTSDKKFWERLISTGEPCFSALPAEFKNDIELAKLAIKINQNNWVSIPRQLKSDDGLIDAVLDVIRNDGYYITCILSDLPEKYRKDKDVIKQLVSIKVEEFKASHDELKKDKDFILEILQKNCEVINVLGAEFLDDPLVIDAALKSAENGFGSFSTQGSWFQSRSIDWIKSNKDRMSQIISLDQGIADVLSDGPDYNLEEFTIENYEYQSCVLICKLLDEFGIQGLDPEKMLDEVEGADWADIRIGQYCLYHHSIMRSVQSSFCAHFNVIGMLTMDTDADYEDSDDFLNGHNPFIKTAFSFAYDMITEEA
jgi:hypothetical protein